jgi:hypothetical protein
VSGQVGEDIARAETFSMPILLILLTLVFGSFVASGTPLLVGGLAILGAFTATRLLTQVTDVSVFALNVITLIGWAWPSTTRCSWSAGSGRSWRPGVTPERPSSARWRPPGAPSWSAG